MLAFLRRSQRKRLKLKDSHRNITKAKSGPGQRRTGKGKMEWWCDGVMAWCEVRSDQRRKEERRRTEEKKKEEREVPKSGKKKQRRGKRLVRRGDTRGKGKMELWCDGRMAWKEKKSREAKKKRSEEKRSREERRDCSKRSKSRILTLLIGKLSKITKSWIFPSQDYQQQLRKKTLKGSRHFEDRPFQLRGATKSGKHAKNWPPRSAESLEHSSFTAKTKRSAPHIQQILNKTKSWLEDQNRCGKNASSRSIEKPKGCWPPRQNPLCFAGRRDAVTATCKTQWILTRRP